ncbi:MAG: exopolysaccharide biosynthesis polyprenyl glycosylphosphotransferase [Actinomycetota bacterium]
MLNAASNTRVGNTRVVIPVALRALEAQRLVNLIAFKASPAMAAGLIAYVHMGEVGSALLVAAAMLGALQLVERSRLPLGLMPAARLGLALSAPVLGAGAAAALALAAGQPMALAELQAPVAGAWLIMGLGAWVTTRFDDDRRARVAVIGSPGLASDLADELEAAGIRAYEVIGWLGREAPGPDTGRLEYLGGLGEVRSAVLERQIELLVYGRAEPADASHGADPDRDPYAVIADSCLDLPVRMLEANQLYEDLLGHVPLGTTDSAWFRYIMHPRFRPTSPLWKRCFDLANAAWMAIIVLPLIGIAGVAIKLADGGPVFYRQRRVGERGREFEIYKLRTMVPDAEARGPQWCEPGDERVTRLGRFLRRSHLDELPQLWNVLRGEMTLVGPRPERPEICAELENRFPHYIRRHLIKPGITGWAQLRCGYAGSELGTAWKLCHDLYYIKRRSILVDWLIIVETVFQAGRDAHRALRAPRHRFIVGEVSE